VLGDGDRLDDEVRQHDRSDGDHDQEVDRTFAIVSAGRDTSAERSYHPDMPTWRCPHCSTPQPEASRCWVCHRSSTSCGTCRHFRRSVAARVGFCGLDRRRQPLQGDEVRACWTDGAVGLTPDPVTPGLLDLLTVTALGGSPDSVEAPPSERAAARFATNAGSGSRRLWVELEP
jgi:hypothetical protein